MAAVRAQVDAGSNYVRQQGPGDKVMEQSQLTTISTAGSGTLTAAAVLGGIIERTGPGAGYADVLDTADLFLAANPNFSVGDTIEFIVRNTVAFANTVAVSTGIELAGANTAIAASLVRGYQLRCLSNMRSRILQVTTTNASAVLSGLTASQVATLMAGMGVTGTNIPAATTIIATSPQAGTVTMSAVATGTGSVAGTFFPRFELRGLWSTTL